MKNRFFLFCFLFVASLCPLVAQGEGEVLDPCETPERTEAEMAQLPWYGNNDYLFHVWDSLNAEPVEDRSGGACPTIDKPFLVPIQFWIYRASGPDNTLATDRQLQIMMDRLNQLAQNNGINFRFYMACPIVITNDNLLNTNDAEVLWNMPNLPTNPHAVNIHVVKGYEGVAGVYHQLGDFIFVDRDIYTNSVGYTTLAHELGHYFGLEHTHRAWQQSLCLGHECVDRNIEMPPFCSKNGKICEKNGDGLCDTPADPQLNRAGMMSGCNYVGTATDRFGTPYTPDVTNIMSYAKRNCRTSFSLGQRAVMTLNWLRRQSLNMVDDEGIDADQYEPDDSDFPEVPRPIAVGETQCHSFNKMPGCSDPVDWLIMSLNDGVLGKYQIKIESVTNAPNPVERVRVWNIGPNLRRSTEVAITQITQGSTMIFEFPCSVSGSNLLIEVVKKGSVPEGIYKISLDSDTPISIAGSDHLCENMTYTVEGLPVGATVFWTSSASITLQSNTGSTVVVQVFNPALSTTHWIQAWVTWNGCTRQLIKTFVSTGNDIPKFSIVAETPACFPAGGSYSISNALSHITYTWTCLGGSCGNIQPFGNGESASVIPNNTGTMTLVVTATDGCGGNASATKSINVQRCLERIQEIRVTPNPSLGVINVTVQDTYSTEGMYHVLVTNQMGVQYQSNFSYRSFSINLEQLQDGAYNVLVFRDDSSASAAFVISR